MLINNKVRMSKTNKDISKPKRKLNQRGGGFGFGDTCEQVYEKREQEIKSLFNLVNNHPKLQWARDNIDGFNVEFDAIMSIDNKINQIVQNEGKSTRCTSTLPKTVFTFNGYITNYINALETMVQKLDSFSNLVDTQYKKNVNSNVENLKASMESVKADIVAYEEFIVDLLSTIGIAIDNLYDTKKLTIAVINFVKSFDLKINSKFLDNTTPPDVNNFFDTFDNIGFTSTSYSKLVDVLTRIHTAITRLKFQYGNDFKVYADKFRYTNIDYDGSNYDDFLGGKGKCEDRNEPVTRFGPETAKEVESVFNDIFSKIELKKFLTTYNMSTNVKERIIKSSKSFFTKLTQLKYRKTTSLDTNVVNNSMKTALFYITDTYKPNVPAIQIVVKPLRKENSFRPEENLTDYQKQVSQQSYQHEVHIGSKTFLYKDIRQDFNNLIKPLLDLIIYSEPYRVRLLKALEIMIDFAQYKQLCSIQSGGKNMVSMQQSSSNKIMFVKKKDVELYKKLGYKQIGGNNSVNENNNIKSRQNNKNTSIDADFACDCCLLCGSLIWIISQVASGLIIIGSVLFDCIGAYCICAAECCG